MPVAKVKLSAVPGLPGHEHRPPSGASWAERKAGHLVATRITQFIILAFVLMIGNCWYNEIFDPGALPFTPSSEPISLAEGLTESLWLFSIMLLLLAAVHMILSRLRYLEGFLRMCSICKSVCVNKKWVPLEQYFHSHSSLSVSHSLCPDCACKHYGYCEADRIADGMTD